MRLVWYLLGSMLVVGGVLSPVNAAAQQRFESESHGYSIDIPQGWERVSDDVVRDSFPAAYDPDVPYEYDAVFARKTDGSPFSSAYIVIQVTPYSEYFRDRQPNVREDDIRHILEDKSEDGGLESSSSTRTVEQAVDAAASTQGIPHYNPARHTYAMAFDIPVRDIGTMRGQIYGWFGDEAIVEATMHVHSKLWPKYRPLYIDTVESFEFDDGADYERGFVTALPPWMWQVALGLLLTLLAVGGLKFWKIRHDG